MSVQEEGHIELALAVTLEVYVIRDKVYRSCSYEKGLEL